MFIMAFINSGLVIQLVYFKWIPKTEVPLVLNKYDSFSTEWYREIGSTIVITLMLMVMMPHLANVTQMCFDGCRRCRDRNCNRDSRRTRKLAQEDYENVNTKREFMLEFRYSNMLTVLAVAFLYSGGMPILYPVAALYFFITYWFDKCTLFNCYRRPIKFDNYMARKTLDWYKYILLLHIVGFLLMHGQTPILQNDLFG
mmetsp:Transcript_20514/g.25229  ORF Transcript_20514/g.25229 Transcript_20514/m.25229 type:complete len:199 (+) Transcript_20514:2399-2995(+)